MDDLSELLKSAAEGNEQSFVAIVDKTSPPLYRAALRMLGNAADAEEVLQESYLRVHVALRRGRWHDDAHPYAWLLTIVVRCCLDGLRRRRVRPVPMSDLPETWLVNDGKHAERTTRVRELLASMDALPPDQRAAVVLRYLESLTNAEVANVLAISEGAVEQRLIRAKATLRKKLEPKDGH